jgi:glycosyltransferase involved in cell wall biosynthesis
MPNNTALSRGNRKQKQEGGSHLQGFLKTSSQAKPLVSIITVVYNGEKYIEKTIQSVLNQTYDNIEYIIIDGGSTDGTLDIIKKYGHAIDYWVSEKDDGIYDAMNKGLQVARGDYIAILNADDYYERDAVALSLETIRKNQADYSFANAKFVHAKGIIRPIFPLKENYVYQEMPYPHVSAFISKKVYKTVGLFDTRFKIAGDHDMALRIHLAGFRGCYVNALVAKLEEGGVSNSTKSNKESLQVVLKHGKNKFHAYGTYYFQLFKTHLYNLLPQTFIHAILKLKKSRFA